MLSCLPRRFPQGDVRVLMPSSTTRWNADTVISLVLLVFAIAVFVKAGEYEKSISAGVGAHFFPRILASGLAGFSLLLLILSLVGKTSPPEEGSAGVPASRQMQIISVAIVTLGIYAWLMNILGFLASTVLYLVFMIRFLDERRLWVLGLYPLAITAAVYGVFRWFLDVPLP